MTTETRTAHTPGPWERNGGSVVDARGNIIAYRLSRRHIELGDNWKEWGISPIEADMNSRLIAAAPDLLAALDRALSEMLDMNRDLLAIGKGRSADGAHPDCAIEIARAAVAQARGEA
jgi:hypothetical protein